GAAAQKLFALQPSQFERVFAIGAARPRLPGRNSCRIGDSQLNVCRTGTGWLNQPGISLLNISCTRQCDVKPVDDLGIARLNGLCSTVGQGLDGKVGAVEFDAVILGCQVIDFVDTDLWIGRSRVIA